MHGTDGSANTPANESSGDRLLAALALFTVDNPQWTVDDAAKKLGVSAPTAYRYFKRLTGAGLITPVSGAGYTLGPPSSRWTGRSRSPIRCCAPRAV